MPQRHEGRRGLVTNLSKDPSIIQVDGIWYSFATRTIGSTVKIQVARSNDFNVWGLLVKSDGTQYDALPRLPRWVHPTSWNTWAPDVQRLVRSSPSF